MGRITGKVTNVQVTEFMSAKMGPMVQHRITVRDNEGREISADKNTKKSTPFKLDIGTEVQLNYEQVERMTKTGTTFIVNNVMKDGLILLNQPKLSPQLLGVSSPLGATGLPFTGNAGKYDSNGARNGMITGKAVELAIARNDFSFAGLVSAARDVKALAEAVETNNLQTALRPILSAPVEAAQYNPLAPPQAGEVRYRQATASNVEAGIWDNSMSESPFDLDTD